MSTTNVCSPRVLCNNTFLSAGFNADVDSFVVQTGYDEYALIVQQGTEKPEQIKTTTAKLYSERPCLKLPMHHIVYCTFYLNVHNFTVCLPQVELQM